jgi:hypothetical protein
MKNIFLFLAFTFLVTPALAVDNPRGTIVQDRLENRQEIQEQKGELRGTITQDRLQLRRQNANKIAAKIRSVLVDHFNRLTEIKTKLETKIAALTDADKKSQATAKLTEFNTKKYEEALASFDSLVATIDTQEKPMKLVDDIKHAGNDIRTESKTLRLLLVDVLKIIVK